jgi:hypothetical protein
MSAGSPKAASNHWAILSTIPSEKLGPRTMIPNGCKGNLAVLRLITQASKGRSKENI